MLRYACGLLDGILTDIQIMREMNSDDGYPGDDT